MAFGEAIPLLLDRKGGLRTLNNDIFIVVNALYINYHFEIANHVWIGNVHGGWSRLRLQWGRYLMEFLKL